jgi:hypothetical protein
MLNNNANRQLLMKYTYSYTSIPCFSPGVLMQSDKRHHFTLITYSLVPFFLSSDLSDLSDLSDFFGSVFLLFLSFFKEEALC